MKSYNTLILLNFIFPAENTNINDINDLTVKSDRLLALNTIETGGSR